MSDMHQPRVRTTSINRHSELERKRSRLIKNRNSQFKTQTLLTSPSSMNFSKPGIFNTII